MPRLQEFLSRKIIFLIVIAIALSVSATFYKYILQQDYIVHTHGACYPENATCFVRECDAEYENCSELGDIITFSIAEIRASNLDICDARKDDCPLETCTPDDTHCKILSCVEGNTEYSCAL